MNNTPNLAPIDSFSLHNNSVKEKAQESFLDPRVLSSVILSLKMPEENKSATSVDAHERLYELMHSPAVRSILEAACKHSKEQGIDAVESLHQIVGAFLEMNKLWDQVLLKEGLAHLSSQYH